ncbi:CRISPR/Cas system-associated exonuclease Cas4, RecB family [Natronorubrum sediminis]|uniref:CRISPR/Cas system-associated exonuclease Cas4, RecB family n=1 Tax=Natronorubrum sediminis TaxID=640943 RepID=A0A1H6FKY9_9EURY|nr:PD-(D/E)XK nuclease family protein [Natronorubrum sediminis]SEH11529.1 CRISPR/Cas system-associated exonuclease Cas4, RecB family [Natronorubrum sediminis]
MTFPDLNELLKSEFTDDDVSAATISLVDQIQSTSFDRWYRAQEFASNIQNGQPYFNGPSPVPDPIRHSPSQLLQCTRKIHYRQHNAPKETADPLGIFWVGEHVETDLILPYFQAVADDDVYVQNGIWVDFTVESRTGKLRLKGETDPVFVDAEGKPVLLTEIKTKDSIEHLDSPNDHHLAQAHAYMCGLTQKFDRRITDALLVYVDRSTLDLKSFHTKFDDKFWKDTVLDWAAAHTEYQMDEELPPADPEYEWECRFCSYRVRCGRGNTSHQDHGSSGLLIGYDGYPREAVIEYLEENPDQFLTPSIARKYPDLAEEYGVMNWYCDGCSSDVGWDEVDPNGDPLCPNCADKGEISSLSLSGRGR